MTTLELLELMSTLSTQMVESARANDWDLLVEQESRLAELRQNLAAIEAGGGEPAAKLDEEQRSLHVSLIERILADDEEIRKHVTPWMESARRLLTTDTKAKAMRAAYGSVMNG